jgi:hypothetical protein
MLRLLQRSIENLNYGNEFSASDSECWTRFWLMGLLPVARMGGNPEKQHRMQPFGGYVSEFKEFAGFRLPTHVEAGNWFGTDRYFPFFVVNVTDIIFPDD